MLRLYWKEEPLSVLNGTWKPPLSRPPISSCYNGPPMNWNVPTLGGIQRMATVCAILGATLVYALASARVAIGFLAGAAFMIANLYLLAIFAKALIALIRGGGAARLGVALAPLKLFIFVGAAYLLIARVRIDLLGFALGSMVQFVAIFIETARVSMRADTQEQRLEAH
jgi:hypothetical protein